MRCSGGGWRLRIHRGWTPRTEPHPPLWSVLGVQAGREVGTEHLPSLGPAGGPGQVQPHVGRLSAFLSDSGLVMSYSAGPQRAGSRLWQGKGGHYKGAIRGPFPPQLGGGAQSPGVCHNLPPRGPLHFSYRGSRNQEQRSEACVQRSEKRGGPGSTRSQGEEGG